jgi:ribosome-binding factor A
MQGKRLDRVNALIKEELGQLITTRLRDSRLGFVTVLQAEVSPDLKHCKVFVSVLGADKEVKGTMAALEHAEGFLKREVSKALKLQFTPELHFKLDQSAAETMRLEAIFKKIREEEEQQ